MAEKKNFLNKINSKVLIALGLVLIIIFSVAASKEFVKKRQLDREISDLQQEIENLKVDQDEFIKLIDNYNSESYIEQEARVNFNYKKKGEKVVVIKTDNNNLDLNNNSANVSTSEQPEKFGATNNIKLWWDYFFGERKL